MLACVQMCVCAWLAMGVFTLSAQYCSNRSANTVCILVVCCVLCAAGFWLVQAVRVLPQAMRLWVAHQSSGDVSAENFDSLLVGTICFESLAGGLLSTVMFAWMMSQVCEAARAWPHVHAAQRSSCSNPPCCVLLAAFYPMHHKRDRCSSQNHPTTPFQAADRSVDRTCGHANARANHFSSVGVACWSAPLFSPVSRVFLLKCWSVDLSFPDSSLYTLGLCPGGQDDGRQSFRSAVDVRGCGQRAGVHTLWGPGRFLWIRGPVSVGSFAVRCVHGFLGAHVPMTVWMSQLNEENLEVFPVG